MTVRIGIVGVAHGHVNMYCTRWKQMAESRVRVVAAWDHERPRAEAAAASFGLEVHDSLQELLLRDDIDAVVIASETAHHADHAVLAAEAGKAIVMQKPMALTLEQADRIVDAVARNAVPFTVAWQMRVDPQNLRMKELVHECVLGRTLMVRRRHGLATHVWPDFDKSWHVRPELNRGMWADDAAHAIDFIHWLLGMPASVTAEIDTLVNPAVPDDHGIAVFRYADGTFAEVVSSFTCVAGENTTEIVCDRGTIIQNYGDVPSCNVPRCEGTAGLKWFQHGGSDWIDSGIPSPSGHAERIFGLAEPLLQFLEGVRPPIATAEEGRASLRLTLACYESAAVGRRVML